MEYGNQFKTLFRDNLCFKLIFNTHVYVWTQKKYIYLRKQNKSLNEGFPNQNNSQTKVVQNYSNKHNLSIQKKMSRKLTISK